MDGVLLMSGPAVRKGVKLEGANIVDIAPTVLYALGLPIPADMDGRVLTDAFAPAKVAARPPEYAEDSVAEDARGTGYSPEDTDVVIERLRQLGYVA